MTSVEFEVVKNEIVTMIDTLHLRGVKVTPIYDLLSQVDTLPKMKTWEALYKFFDEKQYSAIEAELVNQIHSLLKDKTIAHLLFDNKLIKILEVSENTFDSLIQFFQSKITKSITDFNIHQLIVAKAFKHVKFRYDISNQLESYISKSIVEDDLKINPHCQNSCHPYLNNLNGGKGDNHGTIQSRTQTSNIKQTAIA